MKILRRTLHSTSLSRWLGAYYFSSCFNNEEINYCGSVWSDTFEDYWVSLMWERALDRSY